MGYDPLGRGGHSWNQEEETLSWDTRGGGFGGPPNIGGREGMEMGDRARGGQGGGGGGGGDGEGGRGERGAEGQGKF